MRRFTSFLMLLAMFAVASWGQTTETETITASTSVDFPEHMYKMKSGEGHWMNSYTSPASEESKAAWFAFYAVDGVEGAYRIFCVTSQKWLSYSKDNIGDKAAFVELINDQASANYWQATMREKGPDPLGAVYDFAPYNNEGAAAVEYMNWHGGVSYSYGYTPDGQRTVGLWHSNAAEGAGSAWIINEVSVEDIDLIKAAVNADAKYTAMAGFTAEVPGYPSYALYSALATAMEGTDVQSIVGAYEAFKDAKPAPCTDGYYYIESQATTGSNTFPTTPNLPALYDDIDNANNPNQWVLLNNGERTTKYIWKVTFDGENQRVALKNCRGVSPKIRNNQTYETIDYGYPATLGAYRFGFDV